MKGIPFASLVENKKHAYLKHLHTKSEANKIERKRSCAIVRSA